MVGVGTWRQVCARTPAALQSHTLSRNADARSVREMAVLGCDSPRHVTVVATTSSYTVTASSNLHGWHTCLSGDGRRAHGARAGGSEREGNSARPRTAPVVRARVQRPASRTLPPSCVPPTPQPAAQPQHGSGSKPPRAWRKGATNKRWTRRQHEARPSFKAQPNVAYVHAGALESAGLLVLHRPLLALVCATA